MAVRDDTDAMNPNPTTDANPKYIPPTPLQTAGAGRRLPNIGVNTAQLGAVAARKVVEGSEANVEASSRAVNSQNVDRLAVVGCGPALAAVGRVPAGDGIRTANVREARNIALNLPVVLPHDAVNAVRARNLGQGTSSLVVALVVAHGNGRRSGGERENAEDLGELHGDDFESGGRTAEDV
jgi:hypothetical protein